LNLVRVAVGRIPAASRMIFPTFRAALYRSVRRYTPNILDAFGERAMTTCTLDTPVAIPRALLADAGRRRDRIFDSILSALEVVDAAPHTLERRRESRYPYPYPIHLTPIGLSGKPIVDRTFVVIGKHLAPHGIDFYCKQPLADRRVIVSLDGPNGWIGLVVDLLWCRFNRHGCYDNGGRFIAVVPSPLLELDGRPRAA
jgi:hypothetical protein